MQAACCGDSSGVTVMVQPAFVQGCSKHAGSSLSALLVFIYSFNPHDRPYEEGSVVMAIV